MSTRKPNQTSILNRQRTQPSAILKLRVEELQEKVEPMEKRFKILERKSKGITRANAEAARLRAEVANIKLAIKALDTTGGDPAILRAGEERAKAIDLRIDNLFASIDKRIEDLEGRVDENTADIAANTADIAEHTSAIATHDSEIHMLVGGQRSLSGRIDRHHTIITRLENGGSTSFPVAKAVIAVVIGIIAAFWWDSISFAGVIPIPYSNQPVPFVYAFADNGWAAVLCGFAVAAIVFGVLALIPSRQRTETTTETRTEHVDEERQPSRLERWQQRWDQRKAERNERENRIHNHNHTPATDPTPATTVQPAVAGDGNRS